MKKQGKLEELEKVRAHITKLQDECNKLYDEYKENTPEACYTMIIDKKEAEILVKQLKNMLKPAENKEK